MSQAQTLLNLAAQDVHVSGQTPSFQADQATYISVSINLLTLAGGASPSVTFTVNRVNQQGDVVPLGSGTALTAVGKQPLSAGPGCPINHVLDDLLQISWVVAGGPTGATANITVTGRP